MKDCNFEYRGILTEEACRNCQGCLLKEQLTPKERRDTEGQSGTCKGGSTNSNSRQRSDTEINFDTSRD